MKKNVDTLPVPHILPSSLLTQPQETGGCKSQELLESVLNVIMASEREETSEQLIDSSGETVDIVGVTLRVKNNLNQSEIRKFCINQSVRDEYLPLAVLGNCCSRSWLAWV